MEWNRKVGWSALWVEEDEDEDDEEEEEGERERERETRKYLMKVKSVVMNVEAFPLLT